MLLYKNSEINKALAEREKKKTKIINIRNERGTSLQILQTLKSTR